MLEEKLPLGASCNREEVIVATFSIEPASVPVPVMERAEPATLTVPPVRDS